MGQMMMMCTLHVKRIAYIYNNNYLCIFIEFIDNKKVEEDNGADDDVYTIHVKRIAGI
jgi:hypothetical protein